MPIYDYACQACGHVVEVIHGVNENGPAVCPRCDGPMRKLLASPAILFKGSGWAKKDARAADSARTGSGKSSNETDGAADKPKSADATSGDAQAAGSKSQAAKPGSGAPASATES